MEGSPTVVPGTVETKGTERQENKGLFRLIGLFGVANYLVRTSLGFIAVALDEEFIVMSKYNQNSGLTDSPGAATPTSNGTRKALILSAFFFGYASNNIVSGLVASKYGGLKTLTTACAGWSACAFLFPFAYDYTKGSIGVCWVLMFFLGVLCAPMFPASQVAITTYAAPASYSSAAAYRSAGIHSGAIVSTFATPFFLKTLGWRYLTQFYASFGFLVCLISFSFVPVSTKTSTNPAEGLELTAVTKTHNGEENVDETAASLLVPKLEGTVEKRQNAESQQDGASAVDEPGQSKPDAAAGNKQSKTGTQEALKGLNGQSGPGVDKSLPDSPRWTILTNASVQSVIIMHMAQNFSFYTLLSYGASFFVDRFSIDLVQTGPYLLPGNFGKLMGVVCSGTAIGYIFKNNVFTMFQTWVHGLCAMEVCMASMIFVLPLLDSAAKAACILTIASFFLGTLDPFLMATYMSVGGDEYSGFVCGVGNTLATLPGAVGPFVVSKLLVAFDGSWIPVFWLQSICLICASINHYRNGNVLNVLKKDHDNE
eukprot:g8083.t1